MWIKICGLTTPDAIASALEAGVDAIGFVFAASPRRLTPEAAAQLSRPARARVRCVAVTRHPTQLELDEMLRVFRPDVLQTDASDLAGLDLPATLELLPVVRSDAATPARLAPRVLFEGPASGTGTASDWDGARRLARRTQLVLAGGLDSGNVAEAIGAVRPFGVDVSSGVEARPGVKSPLKIMQFALAARAAVAAPPSEDAV
jgi:phosphoribosylanthranilate isomerase